jgi:hypothetical protein
MSLPRSGRRSIRPLRRWGSALRNVPAMGSTRSGQLWSPDRRDLPHGGKRRKLCREQGNLDLPAGRAHHRRSSSRSRVLGYVTSTSCSTGARLRCAVRRAGRHLRTCRARGGRCGADVTRGSSPSRRSRRPLSRRLRAGASSSSSTGCSATGLGRAVAARHLHRPLAQHPPPPGAVRDGLAAALRDPDRAPRVCCASPGLHRHGRWRIAPAGRGAAPWPRTSPASQWPGCRTTAPWTATTDSAYPCRVCRAGGRERPAARQDLGAGR